MIPKYYLRGFLLDLLLILIAVFGVSCKGEAPIAQTSTPDIRTITVAMTHTITPSSTPSIIPEQTGTDTPSKQLSEQERKTTIANFIRTNNGCALPCYLGVELNESSLDDLHTLFSSSMGPGLITNRQVNEVIYGSGFETTNLLRGSFEVHLLQDKVDGISAYLGGLWRPEVNMDEWGPYALQGVLLQLGKPSRIQFYITEPPTETSIKGIIINYILYYEPIDVVVIYFGQRIDETPELKFCPMQQKPEYMEIHIGNYANEDAVVGLSLEEVSSTSLEDFYDMKWDIPSSCIYLQTSTLKAK